METPKAQDATARQKNEGTTARFASFIFAAWLIVGGLVWIVERPIAAAIAFSFAIPIAAVAIGILADPGKR
jgi:hypothetical protein